MIYVGLRRVKKTAAFLTAFIIFFGILCLNASALGVSAKSAVLMCADNGEVLYSKNANDRLPMASTTKIMTALLAIEAAMPDMEIKVTHEMVAVEGTSMGLVEGDSVSLRELVYGMLLQSGNDAAHTAAVVLGGSEEKFAEMMNERAREIGMTDTNFVTASGLDKEGHCSTAYDMALLACESIKNPEFAAICASKTAKLTYGNPPYARTLRNHNRLLWSDESVTGIKTGFTKKSGRCLVSAAERDGITLVAVTLNAPDDWNDHLSMLEYGFERIKSAPIEFPQSGLNVSVCGGVRSEVAVRTVGTAQCIEGEKCTVEFLLKPFEYAPVNEGDILGTAVLYGTNREITRLPVVASESVAVYESTGEAEKGGFFSEAIKKIKDYINRFRGESVGRQ